MNINWLEDFIILAKVGSFSSAAKLRNLSQPSLSRRIRSVEQWVGTTLIDRSTTPCTLTPTGAKFYKSANLALSHLCENTKHRTYLDFLVPFEITFAGTYGLVDQFIPIFAKKLSKLFPEIKLNIIDSNYSTRGKLLTSGEADFLLVYSHPDVPIAPSYKDFYKKHIGKERLLFVTSSNNREAITSSTLSPGEYKHITYRNSDYLSQVEGMIREKNSHQGVEFVTQYNLQFYSLFKQFMMQQDLYGWIPQSMIKDELESGKLCIVNDMNWHTDLDIVLLVSQENPSKYVMEIWEFVDEVVTFPL